MLAQLSSDPAPDLGWGLLTDEGQAETSRGAGDLPQASHTGPFVSVLQGRPRRPSAALIRATDTNPDILKLLLVLKQAGTVGIDSRNGYKSGY